MLERRRPRVHFTARQGWINDPLGLTWHDGGYHLFCQYVPGRTSWALDCRWGHATSPDLAHWTEQQVAIEPGDGDDGVWSGSLVVDDEGGTTILYTSVQEADLDQGRVRLATPVDDTWMEWRKGEVVLTAPDSPTTAIFRDPFVFRDGGAWRMLVGGALEGDVAAALSYSSSDLVHWTPEGVAVERSGSLTEPTWTGTGWECPQLIEVDGQRVLIVSVWHPGAIHHVAAAVGEWSEGRFDARSWQRLTSGPGYYAPSVFRDREGRPCIVFWIRDIGSEAEGWMGVTSVPHVLGVDGDRVVTTAHPDAVAACTVVEIGALGEVDSDGPTFVRSAASIATDLTIEEAPYGSLRIRAAGDDLVVTVGEAEQARVPRDGDRLEVLVDGPVVELWHGAVLIAFGR